MAGVFRGQLALGTKLSGESAGARLTVGVGALIAVGFALFAARVARRDGAASLADAVALSSTALAWVSGLLFVMGTATRGLSGDGSGERSGGVPALFRLHGASRGRYLLVRTIGLGLHLVRMVALGSLLVAVAGAAAAPRAALVLAAARGWASCLVYALAFAVVVAPLTVAAGALGSSATAATAARRRGRPPRRGFWLVVLLFLVPAIASRAAVGVVDASWRSVFGVPAALSAVRAVVLGGGGGDAETVRRALHAVVVLLVIAALGALVLRAAMTPRSLLRFGLRDPREEAGW
jgi:hypothetical protein